MGERGENAEADRAEPFSGQVYGEREHAEAAERAAEAQQKCGGEQLAEQQAAGEHAQQTDPGGKLSIVERRYLPIIA